MYRLVKNISILIEGEHLEDDHITATSITITLMAVFITLHLKKNNNNFCFFPGAFTAASTKTQPLYIVTEKTVLTLNQRFKH